MQFIESFEDWFVPTDGCELLSSERQISIARVKRVVVRLTEDKQIITSNQAGAIDDTLIKLFIQQEGSTNSKILPELFFVVFRTLFSIYRSRRELEEAGLPSLSRLIHEWSSSNSDGFTIIDKAKF